MNEHFETLKQDILNHPAVAAKASATGFHKLICPMCNDTEGKAGFKIEHNTIGYSCFKGKCTANTKYEEGEYVPKKFKALMKELMIDIHPTLLTNGSKLQQSLEQLDEDRFEEHSYKKVELLDQFEPYDISKHRKFALRLAERGIFDDNYYVGTKDEWKDRLIIPFYFYGKLIGWQGWHIWEDHYMPYLTSSGNTDLIYCPDGFLPRNPLVMEGVFCAKSIPNGVAVLHSNITKKQAYILRDRSPILVPDKKGSKFMDAVDLYGWDVTIPTFNTKDVNDSVKKNGIFITARSLYEGRTKSSFEARVKYEQWKD